MPKSDKHSAPITDISTLCDYFASGEKPAADFRIGVEHEKFVFCTQNLKPVGYEGEKGIKVILEQMQQVTGWDRVIEAGFLIGLQDPKTGAGISLEPGGQFELSGAPLETLHDTCRETNSHLAQVKKIGDTLGLGFLGMGFSPDWSREQIPVMPKGRYNIMRAYMPKVGTMGLDMMLRTCTVQVNLDYSSELDMVQKMQVSLALQPISTAIFANSPFEMGVPNGLHSKRSEIWRNTDNTRSGMLPFMFEKGAGYEAYRDYALRVPMYFIKRGDTYHDVAGLSFMDFINGKLKGFEGQHPTQKDWIDHLSTLFPEVRLKKYLEMRGSDAGQWRHLCAMPAFWVGILYDQTALNDAQELIKEWTVAQRQTLRDDVPRLGLAAKINGRSIQEIAIDALNISAQGLKRRAKFNGSGQDEQMFLAQVQNWVIEGITPAQRLLNLYNGAWNGDITKIYQEMAF